MRTAFKWSLALLFGLYAIISEGAERLGGISDETEQPVAQPEQPIDDPEGKIIYRVICSPEGEQLPECVQPPVQDTFNAPQPRLAEPENAETPASPESADQLLEQEQQAQPAAVTESKAQKKASKHKKRSKKSVKKRSKKTTKSAKKRKRSRKQAR